MKTKLTRHFHLFAFFLFIHQYSVIPEILSGTNLIILQFEFK